MNLEIKKEEPKQEITGFWAWGIALPVLCATYGLIAAYLLAPLALVGVIIWAIIHFIR